MEAAGTARDGRGSARGVVVAAATALLAWGAFVLMRPAAPAVVLASGPVQRLGRRCATGR